MLVPLKKLTKHAKKNKYALGAFNTFNLEVTQGIIRAAVAEKAPVIIQVTESALEYAGHEPLTKIIESLARDNSVKVPIALHLDHGRSFEAITAAIKAGFSSVMRDASDAPIEENIILTRQAVDYAHKNGVFAQGELGRISGSEGGLKVKTAEACFTDPEEAKRFVAATKVDTLAVSVGNVHGVYKLLKGVPKISQVRLKEIHRAVPAVPLVLHGASGLPKKDIVEAVKNGVRIINIDSELRLAFVKKLRETLAKNKAECDPRKILTPSVAAVSKVVADKIRIFLAKNKAVSFNN